MPRYFFDVVYKDQVSPDDTGRTLAGDREARDVALQVLTRHATEIIPYEAPGEDLAVRVRDYTGRHVVAVAITYPPNWQRLMAR